MHGFSAGFVGDFLLSQFDFLLHFPEKISIRGVTDIPKRILTVNFALFLL